MQEKLVDKLVEEYIENVKEEKITEIILCENENKRKCNSCTLYIVLFSIIFTRNIGTGTYFVYSRWYLKNDDTHVMLNTRTESIIY